MLPSPERLTLCEKIGFTNCLDNEQNTTIGNLYRTKNTLFTCRLTEHKYQFCLGNVSLSLLKTKGEILILTVTQFTISFTPSFKDDAYKAVLKVEGIVVEGASKEEHLIPIISSEHGKNSPAYFLKVELEKIPSNTTSPYKVTGALSTVEIFYQEVCNYHTKFNV